MTALLVVGMVLLVLVVGLSLVQRRRQQDFSAPDASRAMASRPPAVVAADPEQDPEWPFRDDPVLGALMYDGDETWSCDPEIALGDDFVEVFVLAGREGPGQRHREWVQAAQARGGALVRDARARLAEALARQALVIDDLELREMHIGPHGDVFEGRLVFDPDHDDVEELVVRSIDSWRSLAAVVTTIESGEA